MSFKKTVLKLQQLLIDADVEVELKQVDKKQLENGVEAVDLIIVNEAPDIYHILSKTISGSFKQTAGIWDGYPSSKSGGSVMINIDRSSSAYDGRIYVRVEECVFIEEGKKVQKSFRAFFTEARKPNVAYREIKTRGVVDKVVAELEAHEAGRLTKLAREYHKLSKALEKIEAAKKERNAQLKELIGDTFDPELDKFYTRVLASASFTATLAKETHPDDVSEKVEVAYEQLVDGLLKLISDELQPAAQELVEACTRKWKPDPKSPNLSVKKLDEGVAALTVSMVGAWWRKIKETVSKHLSRFDKGLTKLEKELKAYVELPKPSLGAKEDRKHKAVTTNEGTMGKFKTFLNETGTPNPRWVNVKWQDIDDVEDLIEFCQDNLDEDQYEELDSELQGLHIEDPDDHEEADDIIRQFLTKHLTK